MPVDEQKQVFVGMFQSKLDVGMQRLLQAMEGVSPAGSRLSHERIQPAEGVLDNARQQQLFTGEEMVEHAWGATRPRRNPAHRRPVEAFLNEQLSSGS